MNPVRGHGHAEINSNWVTISRVKLLFNCGGNSGDRNLP